MLLLNYKTFLASVHQSRDISISQGARILKPCRICVFSFPIFNIYKRKQTNKKRNSKKKQLIMTISWVPTGLYCYSWMLNNFCCFLVFWIFFFFFNQWKHRKSVVIDCNVSHPEHSLDKMAQVVSAPLDLSLLHWFGWFGWCTLLSQ